MTATSSQPASLVPAHDARVAVSHVSAAVRLGLEQILEQHGIGVLRPGQLPQGSDSSPLVILTDHRSRCGEPVAADSRPRVLLTIVDSDDPGWWQGPQLEAHGEVALTWDPGTIALAVRAALSGLVAVPLHRVGRTAGGPAPARPPDLTPDELALLRDLAAGQTIGRLAVSNGYSERTISRMVRALYRKLGACDRLRAVATAAKLGLLE